MYNSLFDVFFWEKSRVGVKRVLSSLFGVTAGSRGGVYTYSLVVEGCDWR